MPSNNNEGKKYVYAFFENLAYNYFAYTIAVSEEFFTRLMFQFMLLIILGQFFLNPERLVKIFH